MPQSLPLLLWHRLRESFRWNFSDFTAQAKFILSKKDGNSRSQLHRAKCMIILIAEELSSKFPMDQKTKADSFLGEVRQRRKEVICKTYIGDLLTQVEESDPVGQTDRQKDRRGGGLGS